ncbi:MAG: PAS domain-containing protein [Leptolyngbyaceae cyanobacterium bins.349]|nr:PAS domain-containing protein [Leptolyngbyaceae cyanobacterium bins.349]
MARRLRVVRWIAPLLGVFMLILAHGVALIYRVQPSVSLWFPPSGVAIALTLWLGPLGAGLTGLTSVMMAPVWGSVGWNRWVGLLDMAEPLVAWILYRRLFKGSLTLNNLRSVIAFLLSAPLVACFTSAVLGCSILYWQDKLSASQFFVTMSHWWVGNAIGTLAIAPLALLLITPLLYDWRWIPAPETGDLPAVSPNFLNAPNRWLELAAIGLSITLLAFTTVQATYTSVFVTLQFSLLGIIPIVWAACRVGALGGVLAANLTVVVTLLAYVLLYPGAIALPTFPVNPELLHLHKLSLLLQCAVALVIGTAISEWAAGQVALAVEQVRLKEYQASAQLSEKLFQLNRLLTDANQRLQASEERFRTSVENMLDCFAVLSAIRDDQGQIIDFQFEYLNDAACENNQLSREAHIHQRLGKILPAHWSSGLFHEYCQIVETGRSLVKDELIYADDYGQQRLVRAFDIRAAKFGDGFVVTWRDVTSRRQAHEELDVRRREFTALVENSPDIISRFDRNLKHLYINPIIEAVAGQSPAAFIGKTVAEAGMPIEKREVWEPALQQVLETGQPQSIEFGFPQVDGQRSYYQTRLIPEFAAEGAVESILAVSRDITTLKQTEMRLRERQYFIEQITDTVPGVLYVYDLLEQRNVYANLQSAETLGYTPAEIQAMGRNFFAQLMHPEDLSRLPQQMERLQMLRDGETLEFEFRMRRADGAWCWLSDRVTVFTRTPEGQPHQLLGCAQDVTLRKQAELALSLANEQFQLAAASINSLIYDWNIQSDRVERTQGLFTLLGYAPHEVEPTNRWWRNQLHPADLEHLPAHPVALSPSNNRYSQEYRIRHRQGHFVMVQDSGLILFDETGAAVRVVGNVIDISDRKRADEALRESEERLRLALTAGEQGLYDLNLQTGAALVSPEYAQMLGYDPATFEETNAAWRDRLHPDDVESVYRMYEEYVTGQRQEYRVEFRQRTQSGDWKWILSLGKIVEWDEQGHPLRMVGTHTDITERKESEEALKRSQERLNLALEAAGMGIWKWNIPANDVVWSAKLEEMFGLSPGSFDGSFARLIARLHPDDREMVLQTATRSIQEGTDFTVEFRLLKPGGSLCWLIAKGKVFHDSGGIPAQMTGVTLDITDRKRIEVERANILQREQTARQQAEAASRMKDEFLAIVSHELRSPLNAILGWSRLLQTRKMNPEKTEQALASIERNAQAQTQLIEDLLDISRIIRGAIRLYPRPVNLASVVQAAIDTTRPTAETKDIQLLTQFDPTIGSVSGDPDRLQQIVWNLLSNAIKFTPNGGRVEVRLEQRDHRTVEPWQRSSVDAALSDASSLSTAATTSPLSYARIVVVDTGKGISPEFLPYVFDRFAQADSTTTRNESGLGLGLAIVRNLVELHGGRVSANSAGVGQGATFIVELPLLPEVLPFAHPTHQTYAAFTEADSLQGVRVLVVDDEADTRDFLVAALEQFGAHVTAANSVSAALAQIQHFQPHVLLSDIGMPEQDGYELIQQVRSLPSEGGGRIPAAALTAYVRGDDRNRAIAAGFQLHVPKPIDPTQLLSVVKQLVTWEWAE